MPRGGPSSRVGQTSVSSRFRQTSAVGSDCWLAEGGGARVLLGERRCVGGGVPFRGGSRPSSYFGVLVHRAERERSGPVPRVRPFHRKGPLQWNCPRRILGSRRWITDDPSGKTPHNRPRRGAEEEKSAGGHDDVLRAAGRRSCLSCRVLLEEDHGTTFTNKKSTVFFCLINKDE